MTASLAATPHYVLLDRTERIRPELLALDSGQECAAVYGFSDKQPYDLFCSNSTLELTPYPLVKGYLQNRLEAAEDTLLLIVIDAAGPEQRVMQASTMQSVLEAHQKQAPQVAITHRLTKDEPSAVYRVAEDASVAPL